MLCLTWVLIQGGSGGWSKEGGEGQQTDGGLVREKTTRSTEGARRKLPGAGLGHQSHPKPLSLRMHTPLWEAGEAGNSRERNQESKQGGRGVCNETHSWRNQPGRGRQEFLLGCPSRAPCPNTHTLQLPSGALELLRQLTLKALLKSNFLSPCVYFICVLLSDNGRPFLLSLPVF